MELSLLVVFWYGILHAFGPDHLTAIADFSIGKDKRKTLMITTLFALGHGLSLFVFAKILQNFNISKELLAYGDIISATVIMGMGAYLIFMVVSRRIHLHTHQHEGKEHVHIWFGKKHNHKQMDTTSSFTVGLLMGIGGVRGMLITLGAVQGGMVDFGMVGAFTLGVILIFISFGMLILYINQNFLNNLKNVRGTFATVGIISIIVGMNILSF
jgi:ABC-type nickel/cobalt efflux system permease component RcnA